MSHPFRVDRGDCDVKRQSQLSAVGAAVSIMCCWVAAPQLVDAQAEESSADLQARITRVVENLLPDTAFENEYGPPSRLEDRMDFYNTPGVSIAVVSDYAIDWARGFGIRAMGEPYPVETDTIFQAGSISKPIFALAVMKLVQEERIDLQEDVNLYLESWKIPPNKGWQPRVTLADILSHRAGLTVHGFPGYASGESIPSVVQVLDGVPPANTDRVEVNLVPGLHFRYSGGGTTVAQLVLEDLLDQPLPEIMKDLVLEPLGMRLSTYEQPPPADLAGKAATAHPWKALPLPGRWHVYPEMAAAGLWTTPSDLALAGIELQKALSGERESFLSRSLVDEMLTAGIDGEIGIGFFLSGKDENIRFGHGGWDEGFVARMTMYKNRGLGVVIMVNSNEGNPLLDEVERAVASVYQWPGYFPATKETIKLPAEALEAVVGVYVSESGLQFEVSRKASRLFLEPPGQAPLEMFPTGDLEFSLKAVNAEVAFGRDEHNEIHQLRLDQTDKQVTAEKTLRNASGD